MLPLTNFPFSLLLAYKSLLLLVGVESPPLQSCILVASPPWKNSALLSLTSVMNHFFFNTTMFAFFILKFLFIFFLERRAEREREREREISSGCLWHTSQLRTEPTTQSCALTRNGTGDLLLCRPMPNQLSHTSQGYSVWIFNDYL